MSDTVPSFLLHYIVLSVEIKLLSCFEAFNSESTRKLLWHTDSCLDSTSDTSIEEIFHRDFFKSL